MAEDIKSALHDATPSWNGFLYQGKVGLYVCLKIILDKLTAVPSHDDLTEFLDSYSIEYEWIEDFSIKKNDVYESLHQVKHKAGTRFSDHISAVVTILNRKLGRLSETDFIKYVSLDIDYSVCQTRRDRNQKKYDEIHSVFSELRNIGYLDEDNKLSANWKQLSDSNSIDGVEQSDLLKLLNEFELFSENTFESSKVYFHTSEVVDSPRQDLHLIEGIPNHHRNDLNNLRTLSSLDIYLGFDNPVDYELVLSDVALEKNLLDLISQILPFIQENEEYSDDDKKIFLTALYELVNSHIVSRHNNIRTSNIQGEGFLVQRDCISFSKLYDVFKLKLRNTNEKYWELVCRQNFEHAFIEHTENIELRIELNQDAVQSEMHLKHLQQFRTDVLSKFNSKFTSLLRLLFPHEIQENKFDAVFFSSITEKSKIREVFLSFIQRINSDQSELIYKYSTSLIYHPTCIDISCGDEFDWKNSIEKCRHAIASNESLKEYFDTTHLVIKANNDHDISEVFVELPTIIDQIDMDETNNFDNKITNFSRLKFEKLNSAIEKINGN